MDCRLEAFEFDVSASAGWYSAIAGLLAGFALLAILLPLDHERSDDDQSSANAVVVFTCAFFGLLIAAFTYAVLAGRTGDGASAGIAAHEQLLHGATFGLSTLLLLLGLHAVLASYGANRTVFEPAQHVIVAATSVRTRSAARLPVQQRPRPRALPRLNPRRSAECGAWGLPDGV